VVTSSGIGEVVCEYEILFNERSRYTLITTTPVTLVIFSVTDILRILTSDDVLILKKNISVPPTKTKILNQFLLCRYFEQFKKNLFKEEALKRNRQSEGRLKLGGGLCLSGFQRVEDYRPRQGKLATELAYLKQKGIGNINNEAICAPKEVQKLESI